MSLIHHCSYSSGSLPLITDIRMYVYHASITATGAVPYRDFFDIKTPLATLCGATLVHAGGLFGLGALESIRAGYVILAACIPVLYFLIGCRVWPRSKVHASLLALSFAAFPLLAVLPSIGNIPKLLMALFSATVILAVADRRWFIAGVASGLSFLDWQVGLIALAAAVAGAAIDRTQPFAQRAAVLLGFASAVLCVATWLWANGALAAAIDQTISCALARGGSAVDAGAAAPLAAIYHAVVSGCAGHEWVVCLTLLGVAAFPAVARVVIRHHPQSAATLGTAGVYHYGVVLYSLFDFQLYGDLFILLHSLALFLGVALVVIHTGVGRVTGPRARDWAARGAGTRLQVLFAIAAVLAVTRPFPLQRELRLQTSTASPEATLDDQIEVANRALPLLMGRRLAFVQYPELLFLSSQRNGILYSTWARGDQFHFSRSARESPSEAWTRLVRASCPEVISAAGRAALAPEVAQYFESVRLSSENGRYSVTLLVLRDGEPARMYRHTTCATIPSGSTRGSVEISLEDRVSD